MAPFFLWLQATKADRRQSPPYIYICIINCLEASSIKKNDLSNLDLREALKWNVKLLATKVEIWSWTFEFCEGKFFKLGIIIIIYI